MRRLAGKAQVWDDLMKRWVGVRIDRGTLPVDPLAFDNWID
jgi:hypothetical protein